MKSRLAVAACVLCLTGFGASAADDPWAEKATGNWGGARETLKNQGIDINLVYIGEVLNIARGGLRRGTSYEGRLDGSIETDLEKLVRWTGAKTHVRGFQIHDGKYNAAEYVGSIADPSNIDAVSTTRLFTAWFQQEFGKAGSIRVGQLAADDEFLTSTTAGGLINGTFGWATMMAANLPSGGPAYPLATPGARLQINLTESFSLLAAAFAGDPAGQHCNDAPNRNPQHCNNYGTTFSFRGGTFWMGEAQYQVNQDKESKGLAAAYKIGIWHHTGDRFADRYLGINGGVAVSLATGPQDPLYHTSDWGMYGVIDQMFWRMNGRSASFFVRAGFSPDDRNLVARYIDGGFGFKGLLPNRPDDTLTIAAAHSKISKDAIRSDADVRAIGVTLYPIRSAETVYEASYIIQLTPWWTLQPDIQYIVKPGGNAPFPNDASRAIGNALIVGARSTLTF